MQIIPPSLARSPYGGSTEYAHAPSTWPRLARNRFPSAQPQLIGSRENVGLMIKDSLTTSISPEFYSRTGRRDLPTPSTN
jgi:hypothetical protein